MKESWTRVTNAVRVQTRTAYVRNLCLAHRVQYVRRYLLAKIWYLAQVLPPTRHIQQLTTTCTWFIWKGATFRVHTTLQRPKDQGGRALPDIVLKRRALLLGRLRTLAVQVSATAAFFRTLNLVDAVENSPVWVESRANSSTSANMLWTWRMYHPLARMKPHASCEARYTGHFEPYSAKERSEVMRIIRKYPDNNWKRLWLNLHTAWTSGAQKSTWYMKVHDLTPINDRLAAINLTETNRYITCGAVDTIQYRVTQCGESRVIMNSTRARMPPLPAQNFCTYLKRGHCDLTSTYAPPPET